MFKKLKELLQRVMQSKNETSLERFINSKHPQNAAEIEHWVRQYSQNVYGGHLVAKIKSLFTKFVEYCEVAGTARAQRHIEMYGQQRIWE